MKHNAYGTLKLDPRNGKDALYAMSKCSWTIVYTRCQKRSPTLRLHSFIHQYRLSIGIKLAGIFFFCKETILHELNNSGLLLRNQRFAYCSLTLAGNRTHSPLCQQPELPHPGLGNGFVLGCDPVVGTVPVRIEPLRQRRALALWR